MKLIDIFRRAAGLGSPPDRRPVADIFRGIPGEAPRGLNEDDACFILAEHKVRKYGEIERYGPGVKKMEPAVPIEQEIEPAITVNKLTVKKKSGGFAALLRKRDRLRREVENLGK